MSVAKFTDQPYQKEIVDKVNEVIDSLGVKSITNTKNTLTWTEQDNTTSSFTVPELPAGVIMAHANKNNIPAGWLICDGSSISADTYKELYAAIGNTYGGDSTNFKLPNIASTFVSSGHFPVVGNGKATIFTNGTKRLIMRNSDNGSYHGFMLAMDQVKVGIETRTDDTTIDWEDMSNTYSWMSEGSNVGSRGTAFGLATEDSNVEVDISLKNTPNDNIVYIIKY